MLPLLVELHRRPLPFLGLLDQIANDLEEELRQSLRHSPPAPWFGEQAIQPFKLKLAPRQRRSLDVSRPDVEASADANQHRFGERSLPAVDEVLLLWHAKSDQDQLRLCSG